MNTNHESRPKTERRVSLNSFETIKLKRPQAEEGIEITVKNGVIRIAANQSKHEGITLAFACKADIFKFNYPGDLEITI